MKYCLTLILSLLFFLPASRMLAQQKIVIDGLLTNVQEGAHISLMKEEGSVGSEVAKDSVNHGHFHIEYMPDDSLLGNYSIMSFDDDFPSMSLKLWAKAGHPVQIKGDNKLVYTWQVKSDIPEQQEWAYFVSANKTLWNRYQALTILRKGNIHTLVYASVSPEIKKSARVTVDSLDKITDALQYKIQANNLALLGNGKMTPVRLGVLNDVANLIKWNHIESFKVPVTKIFNNLSPELKNSINGEKIALALFPPETVKIGDSMYDTELMDITGQLHHLSDFKGSYILVDFWSFGCGPCFAAVPELKEVEQKLKGRLVVISLSSDTKNVWKKATDYFKMTGNNFSDGKEDRGIYAKYGVRGIPHYVLISPDGLIKSAWTGYGTGSIKNKLKELTGFTVAD